MKSKKISKNFFLISFLPAIAYWYLESNHAPYIAVTGGLLLACVELGLEKVFIGHLHTISKFNFLLIAILGGLSFLDNEGIWFKLQPFFTGLGIGGFLFYKVFKGKGLLYEMMEAIGNNRTLPPEDIMRVFERHVAIFFILYGIFMGFLAVSWSTGHWVFFKTLGFYLVAGIFLVIEIVLLRFKIRSWDERRRQEIISRF